MKRRPFLATGLAAGSMAAPLIGAGLVGSAHAKDGGKTLRLAFAGAENGMDPPQLSDTVSTALVGSLFEAPLTYEYLARPVKLKVQAAEVMPEVSDNYSRFVFKVRPGNFFPDHPAFKGAKRELIAADFVYSVKRYYDPAVRSPSLFHYENAGLIGLSELRKQALADKSPFPYDTEVEGIRTLDRYRFEVRTSRPAPRLLYVFASPALSGAVAREVIEAFPGKTMENPLGTGPFRLVSWKRASRIVFEKNPNHHGVFDEVAAPNDVDGQRIAQALRGKSIPAVDRVEFSIIDESQPRWLAFLNGELDVLAIPDEFVTVAAPNRKLAPNLAKAGVRLHEATQPVTRFVYFGMEHPLVGGYEAHKVALRRAVSLAYDVHREINLVRKGRPMPAMSLLPPGVTGYDSAFKSDAAVHDLGRAKALLDLYGYVDRNGDGWRDQPDGQPLELVLTTETSQLSRSLQDLWKKSMDALQLRMRFEVATWQENIKASRAGKLMMWTSGWFAAVPDGGYFLDLLYGPNKGLSNHARFDLPAFNALYEKQRQLPDGPEREALMRQAKRLAAAYMPYKPTVHDVGTWVTQPHVIGYRPHPFLRDPWRCVDVATAPAA